MSYKKPALVTIIGLAALLGLYFMIARIAEDTAVKVPVGIENAVTIRYSGPLLEVKPFKKGVSVNVRIARVVESGGSRIYDIRYILNEGGPFNISDFMQSAGDEPIDDLARVDVVGMTNGVVTLDERIQDTEHVGVDIKHFYYEKMALFFVLWVIWLILLIFYKRPQREIAEEITTAEKSFAEKVAPYLDDIRNGVISVEGKLRLENLMFAQWVSEVPDGISPANMFEMLLAFDQSEAVSAAYNKLEDWIYNPVSEISDSEIVEVLLGFVND
jgi:hypothetical protein